MTNQILELNGLSTGYRRRKKTVSVTKEANLTVSNGEFVCLVGVNGAGKSTLIRTICGIQSALSGSIKLKGEHVSKMSNAEMAKIVSVVFTDRPRIGSTSAYSMVALGRHPYTGWTGKLGDEDEAVVHAALRDAGASDLAARPVSELSDGEFQKVMIARALAQEPDLMILDEPSAFLDLPRSVELMRLLQTFAHRDGKAVLCATHDLAQALDVADRIWLLDQSGTVTDGAPEDLVLTHALQDAFEVGAVVFDRLAGRFHVPHTASIPVRVVGDEQTQWWTARALLRIGFLPGDEGEDCVTVTEGEGGFRWTIASDSSEVAVDTILELCNRMKARLKR
jgi:iron complex transport system ATP-binding protein